MWLFSISVYSAGASAPPESRAEVLAGFFLGAYIGLSVPVVALGLASGHVSSRTLTLVFFTVVAVVVGAAVRGVLRSNVVDGEKVRRPLAPHASSPSSLACVNAADGPR